VTRERGRQTKNPLGNSASDLQKILVDFRRIRPPVQTPTDLLNDALVSIGIETLCREAASYCLGVREDRRKFLVKQSVGFGTRR
jgi:hypothetical protein